GGNSRGTRLRYPVCDGPTRVAELLEFYDLAVLELVARVGGDRVASLAALHGLLHAVRRVDLVIAGPGVEAVLALAAVEAVVTAEPLEAVRAAEADEPVPEARSRQ